MTRFEMPYQRELIDDKVCDAILEGSDLEEGKFCK